MSGATLSPLEQALVKALVAALVADLRREAVDNGRRPAA